jgi:hypothetical protein
MKSLLLLTLFAVMLTGCTIDFGDAGRTERARIYANAAVQEEQQRRMAEEARAREQRLAEEARAQAQVNTEYARQDGKTERSQTTLIIVIVLVAGVLGLVWLRESGKTRREFARLGLLNQPRYSPPQLPELGAYRRQQPAIIVVSDERDLRTYARSVGGKLAIDDQGYKVYLPDGQMQRLLPMKDDEA